MLIIIGSVLAVFACISLYKGWSDKSNQNTIAVSGEAKVQVSPDIATITFTLEEVKSSTKEAQAAIAEKMNKVQTALKVLKIDDKDIKAENYNVSPKYSYQYCVSSMVPCAPKEKLEGYQASEYVTIKVRKIDDASKVIDALGGAGVNNLSGPNFTVDDIDKAKAEARGKAIDMAKAKAKVLADQLGVDLEEVVSFSDDTGNYMYYEKAVPMMARADGGAVSSDTSLPTGQNEISSRVTITYRIK